MTEFQSTHPRRVWLGYTLGKGKVKMFQSTHPRRVWLSRLAMHAPALTFQSTHPRRVWPLTSSRQSVLACFNPHTHEGCDWTFLAQDTSFQGFNPHTHEGCDIIEVMDKHGKEVSIHTPTKGVTLRNRALVIYRVVSIHTPTKGVTQITKDRVYDVKFQSTHPRRVWLYVGMVNMCYATSFNPHTHEGCDGAIPLLFSILFGFNPHTHEGCDSANCTIKAITTLFQSTHPRRVWH